MGKEGIRASAGLLSTLYRSSTAMHSPEATRWLEDPTVIECLGPSPVPVVSSRPTNRSAVPRITVFGAGSPPAAGRRPRPGPTNKIGVVQ